MTTHTAQRELARGWKLHQSKQFSEAEAIYRNVLEHSPNDANAWCYLGIVLHDRRNYPQAIDAYQQALRLNPQFPIALNNLGNSLRYVHEFEAADESFQRAIDLRPDYLNAYKNRGTLHVWTGNLDSGKTYYEQALAINPGEAELHRNLGVIYLLQGDFEQGWREYRWRWKVGDLHRPNIATPVWNGESLTGKSILLTAEQGLGDTLNFARLATELRAQGAQTTIYCQPQLMALLQNSPELGRIYPNSLGIDRAYDYQCSLLDVADQLQLGTNQIPSQVPYIHPSSQLVDYWKQRLPQHPGITRVGIAWQGNPDHQADAFRSIPLAEFQPLADLPRVELVSLQSGFGVEQLAAWKGSQSIHTLDGNIDQSSGAFMDTAAILKSLDLVITCDTSLAHLAGAMAIPTWVVLGYVPDWRWLLGRDDSPWYPTMRLFRQATIGDWNSAMTRVCTRLEQAVGAGRSL